MTARSAAGSAGLTEAREVADNDTAQERGPLARPLIAVDRLSYAYPNGQIALHEVSLRIEDAESVALVGPNGAGKSTLLFHLNGLLPERPVASAVTVDGRPITGDHVREARRIVGLVFQDPDDQLFCPSVIEDVAFGAIHLLGMSPKEAEAAAYDALEMVGLDRSVARRLPHELSIGERKRAAIAGVLICQPRLLALDEPTANLDPRGRRQLIELLRLLPAAKLIATHDLELVIELCGRVVVIDEGRIVAQGIPADVLAQRDIMERHGLEVPFSLR